MLSTLRPVSEHFVRPGAASVAAWPTLLVVDTDTELTRALVCFFEKRGFHVAAGASVAEAKLFFHRRQSWTLVICDYHLPDGTGVELCDWIREQQSAVPLLLMSRSPHFATSCGEIDFLPKPFPLEKLETYIRGLQRR
jgi:DNA-binding response OmpR family regulator